MSQTIKVTFVCLGNICRSPMAEGIFQHLVNEAELSDRFEVDSCGTGHWHVGEAPHRGTQAVLKRNGIIYKGRARQIHASDLADRSSWVIVMDRQNLADVEQLYGTHPNLHRLLSFSSGWTDIADVPDPYYTGGFDSVYEMVFDGCRGLLNEIKASPHGLNTG